MRRRQYMVSVVNDQSDLEMINQAMDEMMELSDRREPSWQHIYEEAEDFLHNYLLEDHNDACLVEGIGYIPDPSTISVDSKKNIISQFQLKKLKHDFGIDLDEYNIDTFTVTDRKKKLSDKRLEIIRKMYEYQGSKARKLLVPSTKEEIYSWYIIGFESVDKLEEMFDLEDLYDAEPSYKIYVKNPQRSKHVDGKRHIKILQYLKVYIDQYGEENLYIEEYAIGVIVSVLIDIDKFRLKSAGQDFIMYQAQQNVYIDLAIYLYEKHYKNLIDLLLKNYKKGQTDIDLELDKSKQKEALNVSLKLAKKRLDFDDKVKGKMKTVFDNIYNRINGSHRTLNPLLKAMHEAKANYILQTEDGTNFYPIITDMLLDIHRFHYLFREEKGNVDSLKKALSTFKNSKYSDDFEGFRSKAIYSKAEILNKVNRNQIENYLLHLYYKVLPENKDALRRLYKQIMFPTNVYSLQAGRYENNLDMKRVPISTYIRYYSHFIL